jgi:hypothetical protein
MPIFTTGNFHTDSAKTGVVNEDTTKALGHENFNEWSFGEGIPRPASIFRELLARRATPNMGLMYGYDVLQRSGNKGITYFSFANDTNTKLLQQGSSLWLHPDGSQGLNGWAPMTATGCTRRGYLVNSCYNYQRSNDVCFFTFASGGEANGVIDHELHSSFGDSWGRNCVSRTSYNHIFSYPAGGNVGKFNHISDNDSSQHTTCNVSVYYADRKTSQYSSGPDHPQSSTSSATSQVVAHRDHHYVHGGVGPSHSSAWTKHREGIIRHSIATENTAEWVGSLGTSSRLGYEQHNGGESDSHGYIVGGNGQSASHPGMADFWATATGVAMRGSWSNHQNRHKWTTKFAFGNECDSWLVSNLIHSRETCMRISCSPSAMYVHGGGTPYPNTWLPYIERRDFASDNNSVVGDDSAWDNEHSGYSAAYYAIENHLCSITY